jgi:hypothetical protein
MSLTADQLKTGVLTSGKITKIINEQIEIIESKLIRYDKRMGTNTVEHDLPIIEAIAGLSKKDAQLYIYASIIHNLTERGFSVKLDIERAVKKLYISWYVSFDAEIVASCTKIINRAVHTQPITTAQIGATTAQTGARPLNASTTGYSGRFEPVI